MISKCIPLGHEYVKYNLQFEECPTHFQSVTYPTRRLPPLLFPIQLTSIFSRKVRNINELAGMHANPDHFIFDFID
jgi:hypothetical protein